MYIIRVRILEIRLNIFSRVHSPMQLVRVVLIRHAILVALQSSCTVQKRMAPPYFLSRRCAINKISREVPSRLVRHALLRLGIFTLNYASPLHHAFLRYWIPVCTYGARSGAG